MRLLYQLISCLILAMVFAPSYVNCSSWWPWIRYHVAVTNWMPSETLETHCFFEHDKHDRNIPVYENLTWSFKTQFLTGVTYHCDIYRLNMHIRFIAFEDSTYFIDGRCGGRHCFWNATKEGIALKNLNTGEYVLAQIWRSRENEEDKQTIDLKIPKIS
ncbi:hypothetical protein RND81_13G178600 [Saponaria officinalis]|uniref:S-protein homolog n=1 Tax=Saponaria officinalis TaxID=3572 RepID=A0AAW1H6P0_SAPOF